MNLSRCTIDHPVSSGLGKTSRQNMSATAAAFAGSGHGFPPAGIAKVCARLISFAGKSERVGRRG
jgi:hypothetical protein